jgi:hypothetical protein
MVNVMCSYSLTKHTQDIESLVYVDQVILSSVLLTALCLLHNPSSVIFTQASVFENVLPRQVFRSEL